MKQNNLSISKDCFNLSLLSGANYTGITQMPAITPTILITTSIEVIPFNYALTCKHPDKYFVHFYLDDYQFERIWNRPHFYMNILKRFKGVIAPDFSVYTDMPRAMQIWQIFKNRTLTYFYQKNGIDVIPNVSWAKSDSYNFCFDGLPKNSILSVSSVGCMLNPQSRLNFCEGFEQMQKTLTPTKVLFFGIIPDSLKKYTNIHPISPYQKKFDKKHKEVYNGR